MGQLRWYLISFWLHRKQKSGCGRSALLLLIVILYKTINTILKEVEHLKLTYLNFILYYLILLIIIFCRFLWLN